MSGRIVLFGATGYTGELTARAMVARGLAPVLAARSESRVSALAAELGGLEHAVADATRPVTLAALVHRGDVLVTTVGPFTRWGATVVEAALAAGAHYLDSAGEPGFISRIFRTWGPQADTAGCALLTAMGYDFVPGNLAAALALADAGRSATRVDVGYFTTVTAPADRGQPGGALGGVLGLTSAGTRASIADAVLEPGLVLRHGRLAPEPAGRHRRRFEVGGRSWEGVSVAGSEHLTLPSLHPYLTDVGVYLGWAGRASRAVQLLSYPLSAALAVPGVRGGAHALLSRAVSGSSSGPDAAARARTGALVVAEASDPSDPSGHVLGRAVLEGGNPYEFTAALLAWGAERAAAGAVRESGALGPVEAFGVDELAVGVAEAGIKRIDCGFS